MEDEEAKEIAKRERARLKEMEEQRKQQVDQVRVVRSLGGVALVGGGAGVGDG